MRSRNMMQLKKQRYLAASGLTLLSLTACQSAPSPQDAFMENLNALCGQSFAGQVVSDDPRDADWAKETLIMHVRDCDESRVAIPLHVGADRSRTWIISKTDTGLRLKHDHRHKDGSEDVLTQYGGDTTASGSATAQAFPADAFSKNLFVRENIPDSANNVWSVDVSSEQFTYQLNRDGRHFKAEFDLTKPVKTPPPAWGYRPDTGSRP